MQAHLRHSPRFLRAAAAALLLSTGLALGGCAKLNDVTGLETLNIASGGNASSNTLTNNQVSAQQVLTGSVNFSTTASGPGQALKFDASAFTGKLTINGTSTGSGNDTVVLGSGKSIFDGSERAGALKLVDHFVAETGVTIATYEPAGDVRTGTFETKKPSEPSGPKQSPRNAPRQRPSVKPKRSRPCKRSPTK